MGKDQNAQGGLVCAHPAFSVIHCHRPLLSFFFLGRDPRDPGPGFFAQFFPLLSSFIF